MSDTRKVDLESCLPDYLKEIRELKEITRLEDTELQVLYDKSKELWKDGFIRTAGYQGIKKWESLLGIKGKGTLEDRREAVLVRWSKKLPYTMQTLVDLLLLWNGMEEFTVDASGFSDYEIRIDIKNQPLPVLHSIKEEIKEMLPANLILYFFGRYLEEYGVKVQWENGIHFETGFYPRYNQAFLNLDNTWKLDGNWQLDGYKGGFYLDFCPVAMRIGAAVREETKTKQQLRLFSHAQGEIIFFTLARISQPTRASPVGGEQLRLMASAKEQVLVGQIRVHNISLLEGVWQLDGGRELNGGLSILE